MPTWALADDPGDSTWRLDRWSFAATGPEDDVSVLEMNGLHSAARVTMTSAGVCTTRSRLLFPTRYARPQDFRGYLSCAFDLPLLPLAPSISYDGVCLKFSSTNVTLSVFVSPRTPTIWAVYEYSSEVDVKPDTSNILVSENSHRVTRYTTWKSARRFEVAFSCMLYPGVLTSAEDDMRERNSLVREWTSNIVLRTNNRSLDAACYFAKIRSCEAVFAATRLGLVHSPGGGMFYGGVWCNDQAEYAAPILSLLGSEGSDIRNGIINSLLVLAAYFNTDTRTVPYSIEIDGGYVGQLDRGDAAMFALGASRTITALDNPKITKQLFQHIRFCCDIMKMKIDASKHHILPSQSDELEGRFETGDANFSVNCIAIEAFDAAADAAAVANFPKLVSEYKDTTQKLRVAVHNHFSINSPEKYSYFAGCNDPRGWICLAPIAGLPDGKAAVQYALSTLWAPDGVLVSASAPDVWDRCTLYTIRAAFQAGLSDKAMERLCEFVTARLHSGVAAPYAVENNSSWAQLSAESALLLRVVSEGLLGLRYRAGSVLEVTPVCPSEWDSYQVDSVPISGLLVDITVSKNADRIQLKVKFNDDIISESGRAGSCFTLTAKESASLSLICSER